MVSSAIIPAYLIRSEENSPFGKCIRLTLEAGRLQGIVGICAEGLGPSFDFQVYTVAFGFWVSGAAQGLQEAAYGSFLDGCHYVQLWIYGLKLKTCLLFISYSTRNSYET